MATNCPRGMARSIPRRISTLWVGVWMVRVSRMTSMMGGPWPSVVITSVMIMAVSLRLMLWIALAVALTACGNRAPEQPLQKNLQHQLQQDLQRGEKQFQQEIKQVEDTRPVIDRKSV